MIKLDRTRQKLTTLAVLLHVVTFGFSAHAALVATSPSKTADFDPSSLSKEEQSDYLRFPNLIRFARSISTDTLIATPPGNQHLIAAKEVFQPSQTVWNDFFAAAVADKATNLRAFAIIAREVKRRGITLYGPGKDFERAVSDNKIDLGLSLPATKIGLGIWAPNPANTDPEYQLSLSVIYSERYIHQFPDEVLPANLKIGFGDQVEYEIDGQKQSGFILTADVFNGPNGIGFKNVKGVGGQKRGLLGFFQKVFFFLPDAVHSMTINEKENTMITEALIDTVVKDFETREVYRIRKQL
ncbi:MAG TPA: hypothetical protein PLH57_01380 [Oligoflexia bacterium]|nr:hypothetical protein [Oligoflexia bacterium]